MSTTLSQRKIALLAGNGFNENEMTAMQRALQAAGAKACTIGMGGTLLQGWGENGWGHHFAADTLLNEALAVDYDIVIVPGGARNIENLKATAHTKRFLRGFMDAGKQVVLFDEAVALVAFAELAEGRHLADEENDFVVDDNLITLKDADAEAAVEKIMAELTGFASLKKAA